MQETLTTSTSAECVTHHIPALRAFARTFERNPVDADDLVQETLVKAIAHADQFQPGTRMKSWLFTIMRNTFLTRIKKAARERPGKAACASDRRSVEAPQEWSIRSRETSTAVAALPQKQRETIVAVAMLGTSYVDAARLFGCNIGTIKSRLNRARFNLAKALGEASAASVNERSSHISRHDRVDQPPY